MHKDVQGCTDICKGAQGYARVCKDVQRYAKMHKDAQGCTRVCKGVQGSARPCVAPTTLGCCHPIRTRGARRAAVPQLPQEATSRCRVPVVLGLAWPLCPHHAQGMLSPVSGLKINSLGTLGKKEAISVTALPKRLSPCVALARLLLLEISRHREALLRTSDTLFTSPIPRHSFSSRAVAAAPFFSRSLGREM